MFGFDSLEELCEALQRKADNCTCVAIGIFGQSDNFCQHVDEPNHLVHQNSESVVLPTLITIVAIIALVGNTAVVWIKSRKGEKKSRHTCLIILLAISDMFFAVFVLIYHIPLFYTSEWVYGLVGCKMISCSATLGAWIAIGIILIIAIERFFGIVFPLNRAMTKRRMISFMIVNVLLALSFVIPRMIHLQIHPERRNCYENWMDSNQVYSKVYDWSMFILYSFAPIIAITILYSKIFRSLRNSLIRYKNERSQYVERLTAKRLRSNKKSMLLLVAVLVAFVLCTFPNKIRWLILSIVSTSNTSFKNEMENPYFHIVTEVMYSIHLAINPLIYALGDAQFQKRVRRSILSVCRKSQILSKSRPESIQLITTYVNS